MSENQSTWLDKPVLTTWRVDWEKVAYVAIFVLAVLSRFWDLGARALSHDESLHAYYSWELYRGMGFQHTPLMHGPLRFHLNALFFALFGADDFTVRIPAALFGVALVVSPILLRRWLGRRGALVTSFLLLISPSILYHSRYIRDEPFMLFFAVLIVWTMLSYFSDRKPKWLYLLAALMALMYTTMEGAFIYCAIFGMFAVAVGIMEIARDAGWGRRGVGGTLLGVVAAVAVMSAGILIGARVLELFRPVVPEGTPFTFLQLLPNLFLVALFGALIGGGAFYVLRAFVPDSARRSAGFNLAIVLGGLSLLMLSAAALAFLNYQFGQGFQISARVPAPDAGYTVWGLISGAGAAPYVDPKFFASGNFPTDPANTINLVRLLFLFTCFAALAIGMGTWWDSRKWPIAIGIFGGIGVVLFTTIFTNGSGLGTGFVGSLGYWLAQQEVQRGSQPPGYYLFVTSFYEYLPMILALAAYVYYGVRALKGRSLALNGDESDRSAGVALPLFIVYSLLTWAAFSVAGEKMPWLMVHLTLPMILLGGRLLGEWFDRIDWRDVLARREWLAAILVPIGVGGAGAIVGALTLMNSAAGEGSAAPSLTQLSAAGSLLSGVLVAGGALAGLIVLVQRNQIQVRSLVQMVGLVALGALTLLTVHTAWLYSYVDYDDATEFGVYAHGGPGLKIAVQQMQELSQRTTGTPNLIEVLYDNGTTWPWLWYLRDFPNKRYIASTPSRSDASLPVMLLSGNNWDAIDKSVGNNYTWSEYHRIWWPMEDYKRIPEVLACPQQIKRRDGSVVRYAAFDENGDGAIDATEQAQGDARCRERLLSLVGAVWDIFFQRDYARYGDLTVGPDGQTGQKLTLQEWPLQEDFRLYVRKDLAAKVWDQAVGTVSAAGAPEPGISDPYQARWHEVAAIKTFGSVGQGEGQFTAPHGIALAPDGSIYVADSSNHRVVKFNADGEFVSTMGTWSGQPPNNDFFSPNWNPPAGTFSEPWDVAVAPDGSVYVADTWNNRIQVFDANGKFVKLWGHFGDSGGQATGAEGLLYGPRGIAIAPDGRVFVADTGNKRVQVFDRDGQFLLQFGGAGLLDGNLDEPVGIDVSQAGEVVVADTWNGRLQVFNENGQALRKWDITGWFDPSAEDQGKGRVGKPYLAFGPDDRIYVADQAGSRILIFDKQGQYQESFGQFGADNRGFSAPSGIAIDGKGNVLVVDTGNGRVMAFPPLGSDGKQP